MRKASLVVPKRFQGNVIFDEKNSLNRDNIFHKYCELKKVFSKYNFDLSTNDINKINDSELIIYQDMPKKLPSQDKIKNSYLILRESELIRPDNYNASYHIFFSKIFTWNDHLVDNKKYFKFNFSHLFPKSIDKDIKKKEKLCVLIAANKSVNHPLELYSERIEAIRWFEKKYIKDFDLYGVGWDKYNFGGSKILKIFNKIKYLPEFYAKLSNQIYPSYKGVIDNKTNVMKKYKFSVCYENAKDLTGYITEKIFDSFFASCVPIYWGASNIDTYIPNDNYMNYLLNIEKFLNSNDSLLFSGKGSAEKFISDIFSEYN